MFLIYVDELVDSFQIAHLIGGVGNGKQQMHLKLSITNQVNILMHLQFFMNLGEQLSRSAH